MAELSQSQIEEMNKDTHDVRANLIAAITVSIALAYSSVALRMFARWKSRTPLKSDDWFILAGLGTTTGFIIASYFMVHFGLGVNINVVTQMNTMQPFVESVVTAQVLYSVSIIPIKASILCLYHRLFPSRKLYKISLGLGIFIASYAIAQAVCFILQCIPLSVRWTPGAKGQCIDLNAMLTTMAVLNVSTDFILIGLPIPFLLHLRVDNTRRLQLIGTFLLGGTVCIFGILRSVFVGTADPTNPSRSYAQGAMWSVLEVCVGIVSACLPTLRPLFRARAAKTPTGSHNANPYGMGSRSGGKDHSHIIPMGSKLKPAAAFESDDRHPFAKLDDVESRDLGHGETRAYSPLDVRDEDRGRSSSKGRRERSRSRAIMVTTDIRIHDDPTLPS